MADERKQTSREEFLDQYPYWQEMEGDCQLMIAMIKQIETVSVEGLKAAANGDIRSSVRRFEEILEGMQILKKVCGITH